MPLRLHQPISQHAFLHKQQKEALRALLNFMKKEIDYFFMSPFNNGSRWETVVFRAESPKHYLVGVRSAGSVLFRSGPVLIVAWMLCRAGPWCRSWAPVSLLKYEMFWPVFLCLKLLIKLLNVHCHLLMRVIWKCRPLTDQPPLGIYENNQHPSSIQVVN